MDVRDLKLVQAEIAERRQITKLHELDELTAQELLETVDAAYRHWLARELEL